MDNIGARIESAVNEINERVTQGMRARAYEAANELRNSSQMILRGQRSGRKYRVPGTNRKYRASVAGEPPAVRTGAFRNSWQAKTEVTGSGTTLKVKPYIESSVRTDGGQYLLGEILENGNAKIAPRPHHDKIKQHALPKIKRIYKRQYY